MLKKSVSSRFYRHRRIRKKVFGTKSVPRLCVFRSLNHIYGQLIDDEKRSSILTVSSLSKELKGQAIKGNINQAKAVGALLAARAKDKGIERVIFDRAGYLYHGRVKALADAAREGGLKF
jgi:large subunit ribosomal protein L18